MSRHDHNNDATTSYRKEYIVVDGSISVPLLTDDPASWSGSSLLSVTQITPAGLQFLWQQTQSMRARVRERGGDRDLLRQKLVATVFFEASTRTSCSFQAAALRLGAQSLHVDGGASGNTSAAKKGESLEDTIRCLECYTDAIVLRHPVTGSVGRVMGMCQKPVLNAGDGVGEHPTQALLDAFTIYDELKLDAATTVPANLTVVLLGDLKHGRTVHSLAQLLAATTRNLLWRDRLTLRCCAPPGLQLPDYVRDACAVMDGVHVEMITEGDPAAILRGGCVQVLYVTRIQRERFATEADYQAVKGSYVVDANFMKQAPVDMMVLHPLPRVDEIATEVDRDPRAAYFRQMENGMFVRMALLALILGGSSS